VISIVLTVASLGLAVAFARKQSRIRVGFDLARAIISVAAILVMAAITRISTPTIAIVLAIGGGLVLGLGQGANLEVSRSERGVYARRNPTAIALWGVGIVIMQAAGIASRAGVVRLGQTMAWFSACLGIGLLAGRTRPIRRSATAGLIVVAVSAGAIMFQAPAPSQARAIQLSDQDLCDLTPGDWSWSTGVAGVDNVLYQYVDPATTFVATVPAAIAGCANTAEHDPGGGAVEVGIYLLSDAADPSVEVQRIATQARDAGAEVYLSDAEFRGSPLHARLGDRRQLPMDVARISWMEGYRILYLGSMGPFIVVGSAEDDGSTGPDGDSLGYMIQRMEETASNIQALIGAASTGTTIPPTTIATVTTATPAPGAEQGVGTGQGPDTSEVTHPVVPVVVPPTGGDGEDSPIRPEEAAKQAIAGLIAAVAIGLITWGEATVEIAGILGSLPDGGSAPIETIPTDFVDPYDQTPLQADPTTGMVWWPWDGAGGHWVDPSEVPGLLGEWNRELDAETARRVAAHDAQAEADWDDTRERIRRADAEVARRRAADRARIEAFDRYLAAARGWMAKSDAASLGILDRIAGRVAAQGFVTDADLAEARRIANDARIYWDTMQRMNEDDWMRIHNNHAAIVEIGAKTIGWVIDPTKGVASGAIFGATEAAYDGKSAAAIVGNGAVQAAIGRISAAVAGWAPGKETVGTIAWGAGSRAVTSAGAVLATGGTWDQAWDAGKTGFVVGGISGGVEHIQNWAQGPSQRIPRIVSRPEGPRVGYDTPFDPRLRPPERGGVGSMPERTPVIRVRPGGPRPRYDQPLSPGHVDPNDPRNVPPGTPAEQVHTPPSDWSTPPPEIVETSGPLGGQPPTQPPQVTPADVFDPAPPPPPTIVEASGPLDGRPPTPPPQVSPAEATGSPPPPPGADPDISALPGRWGEDPSTYLGGMDTDPPPTPKLDLPEPSPVDGLESPPLGELPDTLVNQAKSPPSGDVLVDRMMRQPSHPAGPSFDPPPPPEAVARIGMFDTDAQGRVIIGGRHVGNIDPETGTIKDLGGRPITIATDDRQAIGYLEQPDAPAGFAPAYNGRGELVGYVDGEGKAIIDGAPTMVAIDADGKLVPYQMPGPPQAPDPLPAGAGGVPGDAPPVTGEMTGAGRLETEPPTGQLPRGQTGQPGSGFSRRSGFDIKPRIPVLDADGSPTHYVEPGPREISFDDAGNPQYVQRQYPVVQAQRVDDQGNVAPVPERWDHTVSRYPLTGEHAPPSAPSVDLPDDPGGATR